MNAKIKNLKKITLTIILTIITILSLPMQSFAYVDWPGDTNVL